MARQFAVWKASRSLPALALGQAGALGVLLALVFRDRDVTSVWKLQLAFFITVCAYWFGCSAASKDVVGEAGLVEAEQAAGISSASYLAAKIVFLVVVGALQLVVLFGVLMSGGLRLLSPLEALPAAAIAVLGGTVTGLLISVSVRSTEDASTVLPLVLIPQLLLSGGLVAPLQGAALLLAKGGVTMYWLKRLLDSAYGTVGAGTFAHHALLSALQMLALCLALFVVFRVRWSRVMSFR